jgi:splicing factor 3A subunit 3
MSASLLELTRSAHEDLERLQKAVTEELDYQAKNFRDNVLQSNRVNKYLDRLQDSSTKLADIYEDKDGLRREEIASLSGSGLDLYLMFYEKLRDLKDYHRKFPSASLDDPDNRIYIDDYEALPRFTGEEGYGKCLDMNGLYEVYLNLKIYQARVEALKNSPAPAPRKKKAGANINPEDDYKLDYVTFLETFYSFSDDNNMYKDEDYLKFLTSVLAYLKDFLFRSQPLFDWTKALEDLQKEINERWNSGAFRGWTQVAPDPDDEFGNPSSNNNSGTSAIAEILSKMHFGGPKPDGSGTFVCKACNQEFIKESVFKGHSQSKKHKSVLDKWNTRLHQVYLLEMQINEIVTQYLLDQIENSKANIEKRQARSGKERFMNAWEYDEDGLPLAEVAEEEDEEIEEIKMTIDNYPVGWDGKPIPYWLYKLHGLGVEYRCEICGNASYFGRKAYEKHFQEWRHAHGMRCLGIPNTRHFHDVTKINDAIALWEKIKKDSNVDHWRPDVEEEFEDNDGNVFNKKLYEDLKRQGVI